MRVLTQGPTWGLTPYAALRPKGVLGPTHSHPAIIAASRGARIAETGVDPGQDQLNQGASGPGFLR